MLYLGGREVRIYHPGPAHTQGDLVVYFPDERALATGDLFLTNSCPAMDEGDMENWIVALDHMLALPIDQVVPGHFELATKNELQRFRNYLADLAGPGCAHVWSRIPAETGAGRALLERLQELSPVSKV